MFFNSLRRDYGKSEGAVGHWSTRLLSTGGKLIMLKHVLNSMPMYLLQVLKPPKAVLVALGRIFNSFLWDKAQDAKRIHWTAWEKMCFPMEEGGLGVRLLADTLKAFSCKLWWRLRGREALSGRILCSPSISGISTRCRQ